MAVYTCQTRQERARSGSQRRSVMSISANPVCINSSHGYIPRSTAAHVSRSSSISSSSPICRCLPCERSVRYIAAMSLSSRKTSDTAFLKSSVLSRRASAASNCKRTQDDTSNVLSAAKLPLISSMSWRADVGMASLSLNFLSKWVNLS